MGDWDLYVALAVRLGWKPWEVDAMDPDFVEELTARLAAQHEREKDRTAKQAAEQAARERRRSGRRGGQKGYYEVVDVPVA